MPAHNGEPQEVVPAPTPQQELDRVVLPRAGHFLETAGPPPGVSFSHSSVLLPPTA